ELVANGGADAMEDPERRRRSRIAGAPGTGQARHMSGHASNDCHIFGTRADILGDNVPAPNRATASPNASRSSRDFVRCGSPSMTDLPPPSGRRAIAAL